jgi:hypothetical protein
MAVACGDHGDLGLEFTPEKTKSFVFKESWHQCRRAAQLYRQELGRSNWLTIDQERIQPVRQMRATTSSSDRSRNQAHPPFGSTIARLPFPLSLVPKLMEGIHDHTLKA